MNRLIAGRILFPLVTTFLGERMNVPLRQYMKDQWESPEHVRKYQWGKIQELIRSAYEDVPFYREMFDKLGMKPEDVRTFEDFEKLPTLTKTDLHDRPGDLLSRKKPKRCAVKCTAGSTSLPIKLQKTHYSVAWEHAASWLAYGWYGILPGDRQGRFWGVSPSPKIRWKYRLIDFVRNRIRCSAFEMTDKDMERHFNRCRNFGVDWFYGYTTMLDEFGRYVLRSGQDGRSLKLKCIVATAENLSETQREILSEAFGCRVVDEYGCGETGAIAYECDEGNRHIMADNVYLEIVDEKGRPVEPGKTGEIVLTELNNTAQPLIRYRVADMGVLSPDTCPCGRGFPILKTIHGRIYDVIYAPNGNIIHGEVFGYMFKVLRTAGKTVRQYQVIQEKIDLIRMRVLDNDNSFSQDQREYLETETRRYMGNNVKVVFELVDKIPRLSSGKMRLIESRISRPEQS